MSFHEEARRFKQELKALYSNLFGEADPIVVRAPARLDLMGGIADYSGSVVLEVTLERAVLMGLSRRSDGEVKILSIGAEREGLAPRFEASLDVFYSGGRLKGYDEVRGLFRRDPKRAWAGYVVGAFYVLLKEGIVRNFSSGASIAFKSDIPMGAGISSSAALEIASMYGISLLYGLELDGLELARLAQMVENRVVGAPCGIMDQVTSALGEKGKPIIIKCQPCQILGTLRPPDGVSFLGIDSKVKHAVSGSSYTDVRIGAFMGHKIILNHLLSQGASGDPYNGYLCNISPEEYIRRYRDLLPSKMKGSEFLRLHGDTVDPVTRVDPDGLYMVRSRVEHPIYENWRVKKFIEIMGLARNRGDRRYLVEAGKLMYASHWSYGKRCGLGTPETDLIVRMVRDMGPERGLFGAKITGGGSGGTVAVLAHGDVSGELEEISYNYRRKTGLRPEIFGGTSPGALRFGYV